MQILKYFMKKKKLKTIKLKNVLFLEKIKKIRKSFKKKKKKSENKKKIYIKTIL